MWTTIGIILGLLGVFPIFAPVYTKAVYGRGVRRTLGLNPKGRLDIVCTTGQQAMSSRGHSNVLRALIPEGEVTALAAIIAIASKWFPAAVPHVSVSARATNRLGGDLVALGGPSANAVSKQLLQWPPLKDNILLDAINGSLRVGSFQVLNYDHEIMEGRPQRDLSIIVSTKNQWSSDSMAIIVAGLTTFGTGAAANFLYDAMMEPELLTPGLTKAFRLRETVLIVIESVFVNGYSMGSSIVHWESLIAQAAASVHRSAFWPTCGGQRGA